MKQDINQLTEKIQEWIEARNLQTATSSTQAVKLAEEFGELASGISKNKKDIIKDSIGDMYVVMTVIAMIEDVDISECIALAYDEIKDRKGKLIDGVFVKESDL